MGVKGREVDVECRDEEEFAEANGPAEQSEQDLVLELEDHLEDDRGQEQTEQDDGAEADQQPVLEILDEKACVSGDISELGQQRKFVKPAVLEAEREVEPLQGEEGAHEVECEVWHLGVLLQRQQGLEHLLLERLFFHRAIINEGDRPYAARGEAPGSFRLQEDAKTGWT